MGWLGLIAVSAEALLCFFFLCKSFISLVISCYFTVWMSDESGYWFPYSREKLPGMRDWWELGSLSKMTVEFGMVVRKRRGEKERRYPYARDFWGVGLTVSAGFCTILGERMAR